MPLSSRYLTTDNLFILGHFDSVFDFLMGFLAGEHQLSKWRKEVCKHGSEGLPAVVAMHITNVYID